MGLPQIAKTGYGNENEGFEKGNLGCFLCFHMKGLPLLLVNYSRGGMISQI
jgi:hypothetical protein